MTELLVDPAVTREKFEREVATFRAVEDDHRQRGCFLYRATFPEVVVLFATPKVRPAMLVFGARIDFSNYDLWAPSVQLVDPFTLAPYRLREAPTRLTRAMRVTPEGAPQPAFQAANLLIAHNEEDIPFVCMPGTREYHEHPAHTGDSWLLHRGLGEGTLAHIVTVLARHGIEHARPHIQMRVGIEYGEIVE